VGAAGGGGGGGGGPGGGGTGKKYGVGENFRLHPSLFTFV